MFKSSGASIYNLYG